MRSSAQTEKPTLNVKMLLQGEFKMQLTNFSLNLDLGCELERTTAASHIREKLRFNIRQQL